MPVAIVIQPLNDHSGSARVAGVAATAYRDAGLRVVALTSSEGGALSGPGAPVVVVPYRWSPTKVITVLRFAFYQARLFLSTVVACVRFRPSIVYVSTSLPISGVIAARILGRQVVWHIHELTPRPAWLKGIVVAVAKCCGVTRLLCPSNCVRESLLVHGLSARVLPNPVDPKLYARARVAHRVDDGQLHVVMLCAPRFFKGVAEFCELADRLAPSGAFRFTLALSEPPSGELEKLLLKCFSVCWHVKPDVGALYASAHVVINMTRTSECIESFGLTLIEGYAHGCVAIGPGIGGPAEIIEHGRSGFHLEADDFVASAARFLLVLRSDPDLMVLISRRGRELASTIYSESDFKAALRALALEA